MDQRTKNAPQSSGITRRLLRALGHCRFLNRGVRDRCIRMFFYPDREAPRAFEVPIFGLTYTGDFACFLDWEVYFYGAYEPEVLAAMQAVFRAFPTEAETVTFIDIGANIGQHSLFAASEGARVVAFEPWEPVRRSLEEKVSRNDLTQVKVLPVALGETNGRSRFFAPIGNNTGTGSLMDDYNPGNNRIETEVEIRRADDVLATLSLHAPVLMKIDVEGAERQVLAGAPDFLNRIRPVIVMEMSDRTRDSFADDADLMSLLPPGYRVDAVVADGWGYALRPFALAGFQGNVLIRPVELSIAARGRLQAAVRADFSAA